MTMIEKFADRLENAVIATIEQGIMTKDLYALSSLANKKSVSSIEFLDAIASMI